MADPAQVDEVEEQDSAFLDLLMLALLGFVCIVLILLPHIATPAKDDVPPSGDMLVEIIWPPEINSDVDLWVQAPGDRPVGYSNKGGLAFNLLRDDLGQHADISGINYEVSHSRGLPAGEYTVNVHLYRNIAGADAIPVTAIVSIKGKGRVYNTKVILTQEGQEITVVRFKIDAAGNLVDGSVHNLPKPLRSATQ
jgi:hypothetical protein